jgi:hypothetical protein
VSLPLPSPSKEFSALPEYAFENIIEFFSIFVLSENSKEVSRGSNISYNTILTFLTTFIASPKYGYLFRA